MKEIRIVLTDEDYEALRRLKGNRSWRDLLLSVKKKTENINEYIMERIERFFNELKHEDPHKTELYELLRVLVANAYNREFESCRRVLERIENWWKSYE